MKKKEKKCRSIAGIIFLMYGFSVTTVEANMAPFNPEHSLRLPQEKTCFSVVIQQKENQSAEYLNTFSILGVVYDHLEGRTVTLGSLPFAQLRKRVLEGKNFFLADKPSDTTEFQLYVFKKDPVTKKVTQHKAHEFLTMTVMPSGTECTESSYEPFRFTQEEIDRAQKMWTAKGSSWREQAKQNWNKLSPLQKNLFKGALIAVGVATAVGTTALFYDEYKKNQPKREEAERAAARAQKDSEKAATQALATKLEIPAAFLTYEDIALYDKLNKEHGNEDAAKKDFSSLVKVRNGTVRNLQKDSNAPLSDIAFSDIEQAQNGGKYWNVVQKLREGTIGGKARATVTIGERLEMIEREVDLVDKQIEQRKNEYAVKKSQRENLPQTEEADLREREGMLLEDIGNYSNRFSEGKDAFRDEDEKAAHGITLASMKAEYYGNQRQLLDLEKKQLEEKIKLSNSDLELQKRLQEIETEKQYYARVVDDQIEKTRGIKSSIEKIEKSTRTPAEVRLFGNAAPTIIKMQNAKTENVFDNIEKKARRQGVDTETINGIKIIVEELTGDKERLEREKIRLKDELTRLTTPKSKN